jgi:DNA transformation protein
MPKSNPFVDHLMELLQPLEDVRARAMFGGYGVYRNDVMFGLVADDVFYLKADDVTRSDFDAAGLGPFVYRSRGKEMPMPYFQAPPAAMEDADEMCRWAAKAYDVAVRTAKPKSARSRRRQG